VTLPIVPVMPAMVPGVPWLMSGGQAAAYLPVRDAPE
jgi:hypothetical protein